MGNYISPNYEGDTEFLDPWSDTPSPSLAEYLALIQARLDRGENIVSSMIPTNYKVQNGQVAEKSWWEKNRRDIANIALIGAGAATGGILSGMGGAAAGGMGGVEAGAASGLGAWALPGAGTALGGVGAGTTTAGIASGLGATALPGAGTAVGTTGGTAAAKMAGTTAAKTAGTGMTPAVQQAIISAIGSGLGGLGAGLSGQDRQSYGNAAPQALATATGNLDEGLRRVLEQINAGIDLPDANFSLPTFAGGGLPMPIGLINPGAGSGVTRRTNASPISQMSQKTGVTFPPAAARNTPGLSGSIGGEREYPNDTSTIPEDYSPGTPPPAGWVPPDPVPLSSYPSVSRRTASSGRGSAERGASMSDSAQEANLALMLLGGKYQQGVV